ncbi:unnamed protein product [Adineta ricciae]|uniref:Uncharacterized protein n=1 Tax=Adineta ricciae TaxID=249248 RepID=A0A814YJU0_ADIRI|nr:unnamed protein product [Adineta ricciae]
MVSTTNSRLVIDDMRSHLSKGFGSAKVIKKTTGLYKSKRFHCQLLLPLSIAIASFVVGILYINNCPIQPYIPIYLLVQGAVGLYILIIHLTAIVYILYINRYKYQFIGTIAFLTAFLFLFQFAWFIAGNIWVFGAVQRVQFTNPANTTSYCNGTVYRSAFWLIIAAYAMSVFFCCSFTWIPQSSASPTNGIIKVRKQIPKVKRMLKSNNDRPESIHDVIEVRL